MTADQQEELDLSRIELRQPARNAIALLCTLQEHGPSHLSGSEALIDYVTTAADEKDDFYTADLYQAAMSEDEGNETVALQAACQWLRNVKQHLSSEPPFRLAPTEIAALKLTRIDDLVETLTRAMKIETRLDSDWDFDSQKALMWERWKQGWTLNEIGRLFDRPHTSIQQIFVRTGGIQPIARSRASVALSLAEREEISRALVAGESIRSTVARLGRAPSTISREIKRNGGVEVYRASQAEDAAWDRGRRPKRCKIRENRSLARLVAEKLRMLWSPEQIAGWLKHTYPCDESLHVSHETIYRSLFIQARGALEKELLEHLRRTRAMRRSRHHTLKTQGLGQIVDAVSISERPASVEDRAVPGHWEGDLVFGSHNSQIATLVERQTRYVMLVKLDGKDSQTVVNALIKHSHKLPQELYKSLTWDRGTEMHAHKQFTLATDIQVYFCDPQSPWQRGSNENTNGLLRQYMPKGMDLSGFSQLQLNAIARQLNERPRKTLGFHTPAEMFSECVALTG